MVFGQPGELVGMVSIVIRQQEGIKSTFANGQWDSKLSHHLFQMASIFRWGNGLI